jgi:hypothetical protein
MARSDAFPVVPIKMKHGSMNVSNVKTKHMKIPQAAIILGLAVLAADVALGAELDPRLRACTTLGNDFERLACYDRTMEQLVTGTDDTGTTVTAQDVFGMEKGAQPTVKTPPREDIRSIAAVVREIRELKDGTRLIELENGQVWRQSDTKRISLMSGDNVTITRAALGSFKLVTSGGSFVRVQRVR